MGLSELQAKFGEERKTSEEWQTLLPEEVVYDPDGWDRSSQEGFQYSWFEEEITVEEYLNRLMQSTVLMPAYDPEE